MKRKKAIFSKLLFGIIFAVVTIYFNNSTYSSAKVNHFEYKEKDYVAQFCSGKIEYMLPDRTRIDCLTNEYAIEFDWAYKWAESIGQSLYYARQTGLKPAVAIIMKNPNDEKYIKRIEIAKPDMKIFKIHAYKNPIQSNF